MAQSFQFDSLSKKDSIINFVALILTIAEVLSSCIFNKDLQEAIASFEMALNVMLEKK